ncbi:MAG: hypothetical protein GWN58_08645, partial [Anaerolineae bacterium]|nr:hypothetical protein [Anaerolineae bacterium]
LQATSAAWARPLKRIAEATAAFLPVSFALLLVLLAGLSSWAPWVDNAGHREAWLNVPAFVMRQVITFAILGGVSVAYLYHSLRPDIG